jgi:ATP phosphoribosyltransferase regulatory subunit
MTISAAARAEGQRLLAAFAEAGAVPVETDILQPAETLLDLYGEDIRGRAYVTWDPLRGEMMLRPDFTVPVVQMHMAHGAEPARYCYMGEVFRRQDQPGPRASEYLQVGYEVFERENPAAAEAEVFALFDDLLAPLRLRAAMGDIGLLVAAVEGLTTSPRRKAALMRHIWRPRRFRALMDRFAGCVPAPAARLRLLEKLATGRPDALMAEAGPHLGLREPWEVAERAAALLEDAATPPIPAREADLLDDLLRLSLPAAQALGRLEDLGVDMPAIRPAVARLARRLEALEKAGVWLRLVTFEASHGRSTLEYYDGFVFSFFAETGTHPPVASGGRYDALTRVLGQGREIPAVGGVIRPGVVAALKGLA